MIDISHEPQEELVLGEYRYRLFLSFDNVLRVFDVWQDEDIEPRDRVFHALYVLTRERDFYGLTIEQALAVYDMIHEQHIKVIRPTDAAPRHCATLLRTAMPACCAGWMSSIRMR